MASPAESPSVTSESRMLIQPAKPAAPFRLLCEELPKVYVFSAHKIFTTFCAPFSNRISCFQVLAMLGLCALFTADRSPKEPCISRSLEVRNTFLILSYSKAKGQKCLSCGAISHNDADLF